MTSLSPAARRRRRAGTAGTAGIAGLVIALLAACGTTVPQTTVIASQGPASTGGIGTGGAGSGGTSTGGTVTGGDAAAGGTAAGTDGLGTQAASGSTAGGTDAAGTSGDTGSTGTAGITGTTGTTGTSGSLASGGTTAPAVGTSTASSAPSAGTVVSGSGSQSSKGGQATTAPSAGPSASAGTKSGSTKGTSGQTTTKGGTGTTTGTKSGSGSAPASGGPTASGGATASGGTGGAPVTAAAQVPTTGPGWDANYVYVGLTTQNDVTSAANAAGIQLNPGDPPGDGKAMQDYLNSKGGLFGRQVKLVTHDNSTAALEADPNTGAQQNCTYFTQDQPVIAVINIVSLIDVDTFRSCLSQHQTPLVSASIQTLDDKDVSDNAPYFYSALTESFDRLIPTLTTRLQAEGYFGGWNTSTAAPGTGKPMVGIIYFNNTTSMHVSSVLASTLSQSGIASTAFGASTASDLNSAVIQFAAKGVTHVVDLDVTLADFAKDAANQQYYPRYAVTSYTGIDAFLAPNAPAKTLTGALGVGWFPALDVSQPQDPGNVGPGEQACLGALASGGQTFSGKRFALAVGLAICDGMQMAVQGAITGGGLDPAHVRAGIVSLGANFPTGASFASGLSSTNFALPGGARDIGYDTGCSCFTYRGSTYGL